MALACGCVYTPTSTFYYDNCMGVNGSNQCYWWLLSLQDGHSSCWFKMQCTIMEVVEGLMISGKVILCAHVT